MPWGKRLPPGKVVDAYLLSGQTQQSKDLRAGIGQKRREQLRGNPQGFQQIVQYGANSWLGSRILSQSKRRRFGNVFVGLIRCAENRFQCPAKGQVGYVMLDLRRSLNK